MAAQRSVVLSAPLCFAISKLNKLSKAKITEVMNDCFTPDTISDAKRILADDIRRYQLDKVDGKSFLHLRARRDANTAARASKEAEDIIMLLQSVDRHRMMDRLPIYAIDNVDSVPTLKLEEGDLKYVCAKISKVEDAICSVHNTVSTLYAMFYDTVKRESPAHVINYPPVDRVRHGFDTVNRASTDTISRESSMMGGVTASIPVSLPGPGSSSNVNNTGVPPDLFATPSVRRTGTSAMFDMFDTHVSSVSKHQQPAATTQPAVAVSTSAASITGSVVAIDNLDACPSQWADCRVSVSSAVETDGGTTSRDNDDENDFTVVESRRKKRRRKRNSQSPPGDQQQHLPSPSRRQQQQQQHGRETTAAPHHPLISNSKNSYASAVNSKKPLIVGKLRSPSAVTTPDRQSMTGKLSAAKPLFGRAMFCIDNVNKEVSEADVERFVKSRLGVRVLACNETKPRRTYRQIRNNIMPDHKAFYLCINKADTELLLDPDKWPSDVSVSAWYFKKKSDDQQPTAAPGEPAAAVAAADATAATGTNRPAGSTFVVDAIVHEHNSPVVVGGGGGDDAAVHRADAGAESASVTTAPAYMNGTNGVAAEPELMSLSPIGANQSGEYLEPMVDSDNTTDLNSTTVAVVDLSSVNVLINDH